MLLEAKNITKSFRNLEVLKGVDFTVEQGKIVSIVGVSGAGKSTLLHILGTLDKPDGGELSILGKAMTGMSSTAIANFRNTNIGFVFQFHNLLPEFTALENVCLPGYIGKMKKKDAIDKAKQLLMRLGLQHRIDHKPSQMSGGEAQRTAVARALLNEPAIVFADEPSGNLDSKNAEELHNLFSELREEFNQTFVIVTHNDSLANMADTKYEMIDGVIKS